MTERGNIHSFEINPKGYDDNSDYQYQAGKTTIKMAVQAAVQMVKDKGLKELQILDAGCGNGRTTVDLFVELRKALVKIAHVDINILGIDISKNMIEVAEDNVEFEGISPTRIRFDKKNIHDLSDKDGVFDLIFSNFVLHICTEEIYKHFYDRLVPGGMIVINQGGPNNNKNLHEMALSITKEPQFSSCFENWTLPVFYPTKEEAEIYLREAGFREVDVDEREYKDFNYIKMIETYINSSLKMFLQVIRDEELRALFTKRFRESSYSITERYKMIDRLYIVAKK